MGSGTTAVAAKRLKRHFIGFEIMPAFQEMAQQRLADEQGIVYRSGEITPFQPMLFEKSDDGYGRSQKE
jgi:site-specific DNA-methyltransferase (adenine-specific)